ncbi:MAG TPA: glutamate racemase [Actinomycetota bacterium]
MVGDRSIGVFDSGLGGLTVARAVLDLLPREAVTYFGDTARSPYGPRRVEEIRGFAREIASLLLARDVKMLVVACNSIEVAAIDHLTQPEGVPVVGVIDPGVRAALRVTRSGRIGVIGTEATIASGAYQRAVAGADASVRLEAAACPAFVPAVERGDTTSEELRTLARSYLAPLAGVDALILGCTHYPFLSGLIQEVVGRDVVLVSSAQETAKDVYAALHGAGLLRQAEGIPRHTFLCSGDPASFLELGSRFLGPELLEVRRAGVREAAWT